MAAKKKAAEGETVVAEPAQVEPAPEVAPHVDSEDKAKYDGREPDYVAMPSIRADGSPDQFKHEVIGE